MVVSFETFVETENSCCAPRFPLIANCYKTVERQTSFPLMFRSRSRKFWKARSRIFYLRPRNPVKKTTKSFPPIPASTAAHARASTSPVKKFVVSQPGKNLLHTLTSRKQTSCQGQPRTRHSSARLWCAACARAGARTTSWRAASLPARPRSRCTISTTPGERKRPRSRSPPILQRRPNGGKAAENLSDPSRGVLLTAIPSNQGGKPIYYQSRVAWIVHCRWWAAKSINCILKFYLYLTTVELV